jgi:DNA-directed RNA polymerase specialized sigma24 family protein
MHPNHNLSPTQGDQHLLGTLRTIARQYRGGSLRSGEELVQLTLRTAIEEYDHRPADMRLRPWLLSIMRRYLH